MGCSLREHVGGKEGGTDQRKLLSLIQIRAGERAVQKNQGSQALSAKGIFLKWFRQNIYLLGYNFLASGIRNFSTVWKILAEKF